MLGKDWSWPGLGGHKGKVEFSEDKILEQAEQMKGTKLPEAES